MEYCARRGVASARSILVWTIQKNTKLLHNTGSSRIQVQFWGNIHRGNCYLLFLTRVTGLLGRSSGNHIPRWPSKHFEELTGHVNQQAKMRDNRFGFIMNSNRQIRPLANRSQNTCMDRSGNQPRASTYSISLDYKWCGNYRRLLDCTKFPKAFADRHQSDDKTRVCFVYLITSYHAMACRIKSLPL